MLKGLDCCILSAARFGGVVVVKVCIEEEEEEDGWSHIVPPPNAVSRLRGERASIFFLVWFSVWVAAKRVFFIQSRTHP